MYNFNQNPKENKSTDLNESNTFNTSENPIRVNPLNTPSNMAISLVPRLISNNQGAIVIPTNNIIPINAKPGKYALGNSAIEIVNGLSCVFIKQKPQIAEVLTGHEQENVYKIYQYHDIKGRKKPDNTQKVFLCNERSTSCQRQCCSPECREFAIMLRAYINTPNGRALANFVRIQKPYICSTFCNRPRMDIYYVGEGARNNENGDFVASIIHDYACCEVRFGIYLEQNVAEALYKITASECEKGIICNFPCEVCGKIYFDIYSKDSAKIGSITKLLHSNFTEMITSADSFLCSFQKDLDWKVKAALFAVTLFIDYRYFEEKPDLKRYTRHHH